MAKVLHPDRRYVQTVGFGNTRKLPSLIDRIVNACGCNPFETDTDDCIEVFDHKLSGDRPQIGICREVLKFYGIPHDSNVDNDRPVNLYLSRLVWAIANGYWPEPWEVVRHYVCDNPRCINTRHLKIGIRQDNVDDMTSRQRQALGERNSHAILTESDINPIRWAVRRGESMAYVSRRYGISKCTVNDIMKGRSWTHVPWKRDPRLPNFTVRPCRS